MVKITQDDIEREKLKEKKLVEHTEEIDVSDEKHTCLIKRKIKDQRDDEIVEE